MVFDLRIPSSGTSDFDMDVLCFALRGHVRILRTAIVKPRQRFQLLWRVRVCRITMFGGVEAWSESSGSTTSKSRARIELVLFIIMEDFTSLQLIGQLMGSI